ncbi:response regulator [Sulfobacillus sp. DSM 109850]|uniref:Stage 0 sporulation protein A homolog n=1 Tax=Sulfobacillus harzensis TaxID=2729629 RepID=A0A7Y0Q4U1_9FIRM|nr:response regulator [Sulfobacillus harzensis]
MSSFYLQQVGGRVVGQAATGEEALAWLDHHPIDLVLTDFQMPGMRGDELVARIRTRWPNVRIAMISVCADAEIETKAQATGVHWLLSKPITLTQLERVVRSVVGHGSRLSGELLR